MREFFSFIFMPSGIFLVLTIIGIGFYLLKRTGIGKIIIILAGLWFLMITTKFLPEIVISNFEDKYPTLAKTDIFLDTEAVNIMILGGGYSDDMSLMPNDQLNDNTLKRLSEGIRIHRLIPISKIVSGGCDGRLKLKQSDVISRAALSLGVDSSDLKVLNIETNNTAGEAKAYLKEYGNSSNLILVTDAIHMSRAMMLFMKAGIEPIPAPTNHIIKHGSYRSKFSWLPSFSNIGKMDAVMHEYLGILWIKMGGE
jgi:uncharacterized SAM-binding protein YcdF (DUF218 family)